MKVLFLLGFPRSGSTLVGNVLGQVDGWFFAGELRNLWQRSSDGTARCGCGTAVASCPLWCSVLSKASALDAPGVPPDLIRDVIDAQRRTSRWGGIRYALARQAPPARRNPSCHTYLGGLSRLYRSLAVTTGARVVVDSSKWPVDGAMAEFAEDVDVYFIHLTRDPRGVAFSRQRARDRRREGNRHPHPLLSSLRPLWMAYDGAGWGALNFATRHAPWQPGPQRWRALAYEDVVRRPEEAMQEVLAFLGEEHLALPFTSPTTVHLERNHAVAGNRNRYTAGDVEVVPDEGWRRHLSFIERWLVAISSLPSLYAHGYRLCPPTDVGSGK